MQTFIHKILAGTPEGREADAILRSCVHCGFCNATCPTYQEFFDERDGPRGRIYLVKHMLESGRAGDATRMHLDRCLTCRACETTCPSGVRYGQLLDIGRGMLERARNNAPSAAYVRGDVLQPPFTDAFDLVIGEDDARPFNDRFNSLFAEPWTTDEPATSPRGLADTRAAALAFALWATDPALYRQLVQEDGPVEWMTFWAFALAGALSLLALAREAWLERPLRAIYLAAFALGCLAVAMEEISWGQRLFGYQPPEWFHAENFQQELNLHNLADSATRKNKRLRRAIVRRSAANNNRLGESGSPRASRRSAVGSRRRPWSPSRDSSARSAPRATDRRRRPRSGPRRSPERTPGRPAARPAC